MSFVLTLADRTCDVLEDQLTQDNMPCRKPCRETRNLLQLASEQADLATVQKSFTVLEAASKSSCARVASDHEAAVTVFTDELKALAEATQERSSRISVFMESGACVCEDPFTKVKIVSST